ncbi:WLM domain-containing protein [Cantharellus anzutake]|uniref:WLM domain-containing protein n=1 Tax=Cantharellus anzutake TaxID=1750568 RepID=UPI0019077829|nr:WLM domain-containing protein [Cantharellus anzutake]KAF8323530.1 WLM domain-containing protein [Cantharellus anzutake]
MKLHKFSVGLLTELAPHEHPNLLGLNENAGQSVKLRIRTDSYDGFRLYSEIRRVLLHELTHNVWGDHDDNFKTLNSLLNREMVEFETAAREGTHTLGPGPVYEPESVVPNRGGLVGGTNVLGGNEGSGHLTIEERRRRAVEAAMRRFNEQEQEIEDKCATF